MYSDISLELETMIQLSLCSHFGCEILMEHIASRCLQENINAIVFFEVITRQNVKVTYYVLQALRPYEMVSLFGDLTREHVMDIVQGSAPCVEPKQFKQLQFADVAYLLELAHLIRWLSVIKTDDLEHIKAMFRRNVKTDVFTVLLQLNSTDISKLFTVMKG